MVDARYMSPEGQLTSLPWSARADALELSAKLWGKEE